MLKHLCRHWAILVRIPEERIPLLPLLVLHLAAAGACFAFFAGIPILACLAAMAIGNDPGGPMFFPLFVAGAALFATAITTLSASVAVMSDLLRRRGRIPLWLPPLLVFGIVSACAWPPLDAANPAVSLLAGGIGALAFIAHWAAASTIWFLPRLLFRLLGIQSRPPEGRPYRARAKGPNHA